MKLSHAFLIAVLANIVGAIIYDYAKNRAKQMGAR
jgi:hypothetical protein